MAALSATQSVNGKVIAVTLAYMDGKPMKDILLDTVRLYNVIDFNAAVETHVLRLEFPDPGTAVYAFTFG